VYSRPSNLILLELEDRLWNLATRSLHLVSEFTAGMGDQMFIRGGPIISAIGIKRMEREWA